MASSPPLAIDDAATIRRLGATGEPVLVVLHGYGANERDLVPLLAHLGHRGEAALLRAPLALWPGAWSWFPITIGTSATDLGARPEDVRAATEALLAWLTEHVGDRELVLAGFSQGGAMALQVLRAAPERVRAAVVLSGFVAGATEPGLAAGDAALAERRIPVFFGHGDADIVVPRPLTEETSHWLAAHTALTERSYADLPHAVDGRELADVHAFLADLRA